LETTVAAAHLKYDIAEEGKTKGKSKEEKEITGDNGCRNLFNRTLA
jgi:hypothetical protein